MNMKKVCFVSNYYFVNYIRTISLLNLLRSNENILCYSCVNSHAGLKGYIETLGKFLSARLFKNVDYYFLGYFGLVLFPIIKLLANKPVIFDAFISVYETVCVERKLFKETSVLGKSLYWFENSCFKNSKYVLVDTKTHAKHFSELYPENKSKFKHVYLEADSALFDPAKKYENPYHELKNKFIVFYYGSGQEFQGIDTIFAAIKKINNQNINFFIVWPREIKNLPKTNNYTVLKYVEYQKLPAYIYHCDLCLGGHFSSYPKVKNVIAGKIFQFMSMHKPIIMADTSATRELFEHKKNAWLISPEDSGGLADAILELYESRDLREKIVSGLDEVQKNIKVINKENVKKLVK